MSDDSSCEEIPPDQEASPQQEEDVIRIPIHDQDYRQAFERARRFIPELPERLEDLDPYMRALLINDN